jgi:hypothetical protein
MGKIKNWLQAQDQLADLEKDCDVLDPLFARRQDGRRAGLVDQDRVADEQRNVLPLRIAGLLESIL